MIKQEPFQKDIVSIKRGQWTEQMSLQVRGIGQSAVKQLHLYNNHTPTIVKDISQVRFHLLNTLNLSGNDIHSIEELPNIYMPQIQLLWLSKNNITCVGSMRKAMWPALKNLRIYHNYFRDGKLLVEGCFPQIQQLQVYNSWEEEEKQFAEHCFPSKMQASSLEGLQINKYEYCFDRCIEKVLQERWPDALIQ